MHRRVAQEVPLHHVLVRLHTPAALVPVEHERVLVSVREEVAVHHVGGAAGRGSRSGLQDLPSGARQAVTRRMHGPALRLRVVIADVGGVCPQRIATIEPHHVVALAGDTSLLVGDLLIHHVHPRDLARDQRAERRGERHPLLRADVSDEQAADGEHRGRGKARMPIMRPPHRASGEPGARRADRATRAHRAPTATRGRAASPR